MPEIEVVDRRLGYHPAIVRQCRVEGCTKWHRLFVMVDHDVHEKFKSMVRNSAFPTLQALHEKIVTDFTMGSTPTEIRNVATGHHAGVGRKVEVSWQDLLDAPLKDLRVFRDKWGLEGRTKDEILASAGRSEWVVVV